MGKKEEKQTNSEINEQTAGAAETDESKASGTDYGRQEALSSVSFLLEVPGFLAAALSAILTGSLITWMDFIDAADDVLHSGMVLLIARKLKRNLKYEYNYGVEKVEAVTALCDDTLMLSGLLIFAVFSVHSLLHPEQPSGRLFYVILLKIVNVSADYFFYYQQKKVVDSGTSALAESELAAALNEFMSDGVSLLAVIIAYLFRSQPVSWIFSPIAGLCMAAWFCAGCICRFHSAVITLTDRTLPEEKQLKILKVLNSHALDYDQMISVNSHGSDTNSYVDLNVTFSGDTTFRQIEDFLDTVSDGIRTEITDTEVELTIT